LRVGAVVLAWLCAAFAVSVVGQFHEIPAWVLVHILLLGAVSNAILIWSSHFSVALLRLPDATTRRAEALRLALFNAGALVAVIAITIDTWPGVVVGATLVVIAVAWHGTALVRHVRRALPSRFGSTIRYYVAAASLLPVGVALGVLMAHDASESAWHAQLALAHVSINLLGWMGLTVLGTLVTLWPTMLHTQVSDRAERQSRQALPILLVGVAGAAAGALTSQPRAATIGITAYVVGLLWIGRSLGQVTRRRPPTTYATRSVLAAAVWYLAAVVALVWILANAQDWESAAESADRLAGPLLVGFAAQLLVGALSFLIPVVLGGGPATARATNGILDRAATVRITVINLALLIVVLAPQDMLRIGAALLALTVLASFIPLAVGAAITASRMRHSLAGGLSVR